MTFWVKRYIDCPSELQQPDHQNKINECFCKPQMDRNFTFLSAVSCDYAVLMLRLDLGMKIPESEFGKHHGLA